MNSNPFELSVVFLTGAVLGLFYFGGLWLTVRRIHNAAHPGLWMTASFAGRLAVLLMAFYLLMAGGWERVVVSLAGFLVSRFMMVRLIRPAKAVHNPRNGTSA